MPTSVGILTFISMINTTSEREHNSSLTRQFTDVVFEDSSPTDLKTVHVIDIWLKNIIDYCVEILMSYDLR